ncbi:hypothetical protein NEUTE1DRAFT_109566 [Neurospora tetrasperma FGSC 2508]|uniref:Uncharacterized protein n=1 Tax=Neurospora tetrasperma (strain FGSC 2508 / ATCC MYA-4615 / P0657) TaxID=510951 RepID=F8MJP9_NEUT8|nr:uncharacterized protein NEUTE1DRAFT_109566 [Neurospora tetrasperma FGSC 2508]EGO57290.1 hypothetical protein NEUTE1DRAFT_109566 [Neurospora tetrasperma FGSC 2508]EGZ72458.1 hypothetical protein NEUTE2DRAFT_139450 [Neurospora tetrasperma FGSC 2509]
MIEIGEVPPSDHDSRLISLLPHSLRCKIKPRLLAVRHQTGHFDDSGPSSKARLAACHITGQLELESGTRYETSCAADEACSNIFLHSHKNLDAVLIRQGMPWIMMVSERRIPQWSTVAS